MVNNTFYALDSSVFVFFNNLAKSASGFFTPLSEVFAFLGKGGIAFLVFSALLLLFKKTRRAGVTMLIAIGIGALFTNLILKPSVARPRPYFFDDTFREMWEFTGAHKESEFSFPSGHTTVCATSMFALFLCSNKKKFWWLIFIPFIMGATRIYLVVHYFTDVIGGLIIGVVASTCAYFIVKALFSFIEQHKDKKVCGAILEFDIISAIKPKNNKN